MSIVCSQKVVKAISYHEEEVQDHVSCTQTILSIHYTYSVTMILWLCLP